MSNNDQAYGVSDVRIQKSLFYFYNVHPLLLLLMLTKICHVHETLQAETETKTEMLSLETETRPRRSPICPRRDQDETLIGLETVSRRDIRDRNHIPGYQQFVLLISTMRSIDINNAIVDINNVHS